MKSLTVRQLAICAMIADGMQNKQIAEFEQESLESVKRQIEAIMAATAAQNRAQIASWYVRNQARSSTAYEQAIEAQIAFLEDELSRIRAERAAATETHYGASPPVALDDRPIGYALRDPRFRAWLLKREMERAVR